MKMKLFEIHKNNKGYSVINCCGIKVKIKLKERIQQPKISTQILQHFRQQQPNNNCRKRFERTLGDKETISGLNISIAGSNNTIKLHKPYKFNNCFWDIDSQNVSIEIFEHTEINNFNVRCKFGHQQQLTIGAYTTIAGANANLDENSGLILGKNCMLGGCIFFAPSDGHSILDKTSNTIINSIKHPILIGDNVWIGAYSIILKTLIFLIIQLLLQVRSYLRVSLMRIQLLEEIRLKLSKRTSYGTEQILFS